MRSFDVNKFWNFISSFFYFLNDTSKNMVENFWHGLHIAGEHLVDRANDFTNAQAPENTNTDVKENYYEISVSPLSSIPLKLDPTNIDSKQIITPKSYITTEPIYANGIPIYSDKIELSSNDYYMIRNIGIDSYVVITVKKEGINDRFFKILNLKSSEEIISTSRYYPPDRVVWNPDLGQYVPDASSYKYIMELENADLSYIDNNSFSIYLTSGKVYQLDSYVLSIPALQTEIGVWAGQETNVDVQLRENIDYVIQNGLIEFFEDIFASNLVKPGQSLYCKQTDIIEQNLYTTYGSLVQISDWSRYNYNTVSGKASVNTLLLSLQNSTNLSDYQNALNVYYGLSVTPQKCQVIGLYESYNYIIDDISGNNITLLIKSGTTLHNFIQKGTKLRIDKNNKEITVTDIVNRSSGVVTVDDISNLLYGDILNVKLKNKYQIKTITAESIGTDGTIHIYSSEEFGKFQHIIDIIQSITNEKEFPEILIYGTSESSFNYDGIYHMTKVEAVTSGVIKLTIYNPTNDYEPKYNDYLPVTSLDMNIGFVHIHWPTHKYLLLLLEDGTYFKAYIDSPLDTIYDEGDFLEKYTQLCRSVSTVNNSLFPNWNFFDGFQRYNGIDEQSNILELVSINPYIGFGEYFPSEYKSLI